VDLGVKRVVGYVNSDGGGPGFMVKVTKQGLSLEANSYPSLVITSLLTFIKRPTLTTGQEPLI